HRERSAAADPAGASGGDMAALPRPPGQTRGGAAHSPGARGTDRSDRPDRRLERQSDQFRVLLGSELLRLAFGLEVVVALPCRLRKPLLDLLQQIALG